MQNINTVRRNGRQHQIHGDAIREKADEVERKAYGSGNEGRYEAGTQDG